jgi:hypothetical protein
MWGARKKIAGTKGPSFVATFAVLLALGFEVGNAFSPSMPAPGQSWKLATKMKMPSRRETRSGAQLQMLAKRRVTEYEDAEQDGLRRAVVLEIEGAKAREQKEDGRRRREEQCDDGMSVGGKKRRSFLMLSAGLAGAALGNAMEASADSRSFQLKDFDLQNPVDPEAMRQGEIFTLSFLLNPCQFRRVYRDGRWRHGFRWGARGRRRRCFEKRREEGQGG